MNNANEKPDEEATASPLTFEAKALAYMQPALIAACEGIPELRQVAVIFDWQSELNLAAIPFLVGDHKGPLDHREWHGVHGMLRQSAKLITHLSQLLDQAVQDRARLCSQLEERIRGAQEGKSNCEEGSQQTESREASEQDDDSSPFGDGSRLY